ncbi:MAG TPA: anti-sigma factor antagonist [Firmicutes bacterium]|nr:anti-sigma factor antagonist [Bacillota bacterium]
MHYIDPVLSVRAIDPSEGGVGLHLDIDGELAGDNAHILRHAVEPMFITPSAPYLTLNMHGVRYMDSTGIGVLVSIIQQIAERGGRLDIVGLNNTGRQLFAILNLAGIECVKIR